MSDQLLLCFFHELKPTKQHQWCIVVRTVHSTCPWHHAVEQVDRSISKPQLRRPPRVKFLTQIWIPSVHPQHGFLAGP